MQHTERSFHIMVDSGCDMPPSIQERLNASVVALTLRLGDREYVDDGALDLRGFMEAMRLCREPVGSASPAPAAYEAAFVRMEPTFAVTLSSKLSGSYQNARIAQKMAAEQNCNHVHVFDSKSASAGQTLVALKIGELISQGLAFEAIVEQVNEFIRNIKTYFVLERYDNLQKNGRLGKVACKLIGVMNLRLLMGADDGDIALVAKPRGMQNTLEKLVSLIKDSGKNTEQECLVISHCNNPALAEQLRQKVLEQYRFREIHVVPTGGISSLYADDQGIVMAF